MEEKEESTDHEAGEAKEVASPQVKSKKQTQAELDKQRAALIEKVAVDFSLEQRFPDVEETLAFVYKDLQTIKSDCLYLLDTNVLLVPFNVSAQALTEIKRVFSSLAQNGRLKVAKHSLREYFRNKTDIIRHTYDSLDASKFTVAHLETRPLYSDEDAFLKAKGLRREIEAKLAEYKKCVEELREKVAGWSVSDPVTLGYREFFAGENLVSLEIENTQLTDIIKQRLSKQTPPGFRDISKPDNANGDILIWLTALQIGERTGKDMVLVTEEKKGDWWVRSHNREIFPHFELIEEYRRASKGGTLHILKLSQMLGLNESPDEIVKEVGHAEPVLQPSELAVYAAIRGHRHQQDEHVRVSVLRTCQAKGIEVQDFESRGRLFCVHGIADLMGLQIVAIINPISTYLRAHEGRIRACLRQDILNFIMLVYEDTARPHVMNVAKQIFQDTDGVHGLLLAVLGRNGFLEIVESVGFTPFGGEQNG